jgi:integrase/recombinase XerC
LQIQSVSAIAMGDEVVVRAWLHGRPENTVTAYRRDVTRFLAHAGKPLAEIALADLQSWDTSLAADRPASRLRRLASVKSLLAFAHGLGAITADPGQALRLAKPTETGVERIIAETDVLRMIGAEPNDRRKALLRLLYLCGLRASEAAALSWRDMTRSARPAKRACWARARSCGRWASRRRCGAIWSH